MNARTTIAIRLKIPDNEAFTALSALAGLGIPVAGLERADLWVFETEGSANVLEAVKSNEILYNPNKHEAAVRAHNEPLPGEVWVEELEPYAAPGTAPGGKMMPGVLGARRFAAWKLLDAQGAPLAAQEVRAAAEALLCNPAIERALIS